MKKRTGYHLVAVAPGTYITKRKIVDERHSVLKDNHLFVTPAHFQFIVARLQVGALCVS